MQPTRGRGRGRGAGHNQPGRYANPFYSYPQRNLHLQHGLYTDDLVAAINVPGVPNPYEAAFPILSQASYRRDRQVPHFIYRRPLPTDPPEILAEFEPDPINPGVYRRRVGYNQTVAYGQCRRYNHYRQASDPVRGAAPQVHPALGLRRPHSANMLVTAALTSVAAHRRPVEGDCPICLAPLRPPPPPPPLRELMDGDDDEQPIPDEYNEKRRSEQERANAGPELVWCRGFCGANFHKECIDLWVDGCGVMIAPCPYCRRAWLR